MRGSAAGELKSSGFANAVHALRIRCMAISALVLMAGSAATAIGQTGSRGLAQAEIPTGFEVAAQPLASALEAYAAATGLQVLYDADLAAGRKSTSVNGVLMPDVALRVLLEGTGLTVFYTDNAFAIAPVPANGQRNGHLGGSVWSERVPYFALVQAAIEHAFCQEAETIPGQYRAAIRFRIGTSGEVLFPQLLGSTGDTGRDRTIAELLRHLSIERSPPPGMPQPLTMIVSPRAPAQSGDCRAEQNPPRPQATR